MLSISLISGVLFKECFGLAKKVKFLMEYFLWIVLENYQILINLGNKNFRIFFNKTLPYHNFEVNNNKIKYFGICCPYL